MNRQTTESTKKVYKRNIIRLNGGDEIKIDKAGNPDYKFLKKTDEIINKISHLKPNSQRTYLISIVSTLKGLKGYDAAAKFYYDLMMNLNKELKENNTKSETQKENWMSQDEILEIYNKLKEAAMPLLALKKVNEREWSIILHFVILSLYTLQACRRNKDYQLMKVLTNPKDLGEDFKEFNYWSGSKFDFYTYKTQMAYQLQEIPVNPELKDILQKYIKLHPLRKTKNYFLLVDFAGEPLKAVNAITRILNKIFGKKIGVSMLRNIYLTDKFKNPIDELKETATAMGTSSSTIQNNYIKTDEK